MKNKIIIITGPTGVGKTKLSIDIAKQFNGEIISADSCQVYKGFDIGSAKITKEEMQGVSHYLIDVNEPSQEYSAGDFAKQSKEIIKKIQKKNKLPIIVGGTGLYINALLFPFSTDAKRDDEYRNELQKNVALYGKQYVYDLLMKVDSETANVLNVNQTDRIIRALEIYKNTGIKKSELVKQTTSEYDYLLIVLDRDRQEVYDLINKRVDKMIDDGLVLEVKNLLMNGVSKNDPAMKAIGYKEIVSFLDNECSLSEAINYIKQKSRNYAKRQITYFKKMQNTVFINYNEYEKIINTIKKFLKEEK